MIWNKSDISPEQVRQMAARYGCGNLAASILIRRGITKGEDVCYFLEDDARYLRNPFEIPGMEDAVERIVAAKEENEKVMIFGDRDADGITSTALLAGYLKSVGMDVAWRLPTGDDRYGLSAGAIEEFAEKYGTLIITVDCGISNITEIARANELSVDVIVTDHHNPQEEVPDAFAIVNPKYSGGEAVPYPFPHLAGCGVALKLVEALRFAFKSEMYNQPVCLLNTRPANESWIIEIANMTNMSVTDTLVETIVPGMVGIQETRLPLFLQGQQILVWDAPLQKKTLAKIFGNGVEVGMLDITPEIAKEIPSTSGMSLLRLKEASRIARYSDREVTELDVFINLFTSFVRHKERPAVGADADDLQLACVGTIADIMPLRDENRVIVRQGIQAMAKKPRPGISNLLSKLKLSGAGKHLIAKDLSWYLCPVINAAGRMGSPEKAVELFLEEDEAKRNRLADEIIAMNEERKKRGDESWVAAEPRARESLAEFNGKIVLVSGEDIPRGFTGIIANRLASQFKVPAVVVSFASEGVASGSLRSPGNYDLRFMLEPCAPLFIDWGGHDYAAGFSMDVSGGRQNWDAFLEKLKRISLGMELEEDKSKDSVSVDAELPPPYLVPQIMDTVDLFEPFGEENGQLVFVSKGLSIRELSLMGKPDPKHVKLTMDAGKYKWPAKYWNAVGKVPGEFDTGDTVDMVYTFSRNWFNGIETPEMTVIDMKRRDEG